MLDLPTEYGTAAIAILQTAFKTVAFVRSATLPKGD